MERVLAALEPDEPDYEGARELGSEALPLLAELAESADPMLASKATYLAAFIAGEDAMPILSAAARHERPEVRAAVISATSNLDEGTALSMLRSLAEDDDLGVADYARRQLPGDLATPDPAAPSEHTDEASLRENVSRLKALREENVLDEDAYASSIELLRERTRRQLDDLHDAGLLDPDALAESLDNLESMLES